MGLNSLPTPVAPVLTAADYEAAAARFWELVDRSTDLALLLALREALREYERSHGEEGLAGPLGRGGAKMG